MSSPSDRVARFARLRSILGARESAEGAAFAAASREYHRVSQAAEAHVAVARSGMLAASCDAHAVATRDVARRALAGAGEAFGRARERFLSLRRESRALDALARRLAVAVHRRAAANERGAAEDALSRSAVQERHRRSP